MSTNNPFFKGTVNNIFSTTPSSTTIQQPVNINAGTNIFNKNVTLGTIMNTTYNNNLQQIGSYRAPNYVSDKQPVGGIKTSWTSLVYPSTIIRERQLEELSAFELRLQDYYSIRTGNIEAKNRNQIQTNIRRGAFKKTIFQTRPTHQPITIKGIVPNSTQNTTSTNIFSNNTNNSNNTNIFNTNGNTNTVVTNPQNIFNNLNNSGIFNKPIISQPNQYLNNNNTGNIFKPTTNSNNIFASQNTMNTSTTNIFNKPTTTGNIFSNNQSVASTNPSTSINIFANNNTNNTNTSQGTNIFNTNNNQSNNIFNSMRTSTTGNNIFNNNNNNNSNTASINLFNNTSNNTQGINLFNTNNNNNNSNSNNIFNNTNPSNLFATSNGTRLQQVVLPVPQSLYQSLVQEAYGSKNSFSLSNDQTNSSLSNPYSSNRFKDYSQTHKSKYYQINDDIDFEPKFRYSDFDKKYDQQPTIKIIIERSSKDQEHTRQKTSQQRYYDINETRKLTSQRQQQRRTKSKVVVKDQSYIPDQAIFEQRQIKVYQTLFLDDKIQKARQVIFILSQKDRDNSNQILKKRIAQQAIKAGEIKPDSKIILTDIRFQDGQFIAICLIKNRTINLPQGYWYKPEKITDFKSTSLTIGNRYGQVSWLQPLDVTNIDFFQTIQITKNSIQLYENTQNPPPIGTKLNRQCNVTLYKCQPLQTMRKKGKNPTNSQTIQLLKTICRRNNLQFVSFNPENEHWTIKITPRA